MTKIQNPKLAGCELTMRFARDDNGNPISVRGDGQGIFEVPDRDAKFLLDTPGWRAAERHPRALPGAGRPPARRPSAAAQRKAAVQDGPKSKIAPPAPGTSGSSSPEEPSEDDDEAEEVAMRIANLRTKDEARAMRAEFAELGYEISSFDDDMLLREMREQLESVLLADEDETDGETEGSESEEE